MTKRAKKRPSRSASPSSRRGIWQGLVLAALLAGTAGCNEHPVGTGFTPEFRGITVPLPPPSFRSATLVDLELRGSAAGYQGGRALLWEERDPRGIAAPIDATGNFHFPAWSLNPRNHCLELRAQGSIKGPSNASYYGLVLKQAAECTSPQCSAADRQGECVCLLRFHANCTDQPFWPEPGTQPTGGTPQGSSSSEGSS